MRRVTVFYLSSITLAVLGQSVAAIALPLIVLTTTGSVLGTGAVAAATAIPGLLAGLFMGVVLDRINRRTASVMCDLISAASIAALPIVDLITGLNIGWFMLFGALSTLGDGPGITARETLLPAIVRHGDISAERLMGLRETMTTIALLLGPAAAGTLMGFFEGTTVLWITAGTSLVAGLMSLMLPAVVGSSSVEAGHGTKLAGTGWSQLKDGWKVLLTSRFLVGVTLIMIVALVTIAALQGLLLPVYFTMEGSPELLGFVLTSLAAGSLLGGLLYTVAGKKGRRRAWFMLGICGNAMGFAVVATLAEIWVVFVGAFLLGFFNALFGALISVLNIERIPENMRGRILGTQNAMIPAAAPAGIAGAAVMVEFMSLQTAAMIFVGLWVICVVFALCSSAFRNLEKSPPEEVKEV
ncbi:MFS transporter [Ornithinimicrobium pratense]|uniref:Multidrug efflux pump Tap n=1 Tax=Ornithinimicrobium pratense TaxID=2593973 RepID=A0A5J6V3M1_9MICO|nr:MFS transporter [Ornithinimicrobium pratense]QFG67761.1 MFS transporter [Ornithinimicrobium pratense]